MSKTKQSGFTLIEIAIVLVIIGLLLGGVLKGQELINSAKVKNLATDFRNIPLYFYGYQDRFKALPGDDARVEANLSGATKASTNGTVGNGVIEGGWDSAVKTDESFLFWQHVRLAGLAAGPTDEDDPNYIPRNSDGGIIGVQSNVGFATITLPLPLMSGSYIICSDGILGKYVKQLDTTLDDRDPETGSLRAILTSSTGSTAAATIDDANSYTVCMGV